MDRERQVFTAYGTTGDNFGSDIDIVCEDRADNTYTYHIGDGGSWDDGCCRYRECGSVSCCGVDCSEDEPVIPTGPTPSLDAGAPGGVAECAPLRSAEYDNALRLLDVPEGSSTRLVYNIDDVPEPTSLTFAAVSMSLHDADHPGEEGKIFINGNGPLQLPAHASWDDAASRAAISVPLSYLRAGSNRVQYGAGTRDRTYYKVGLVAMTVFGAACDPVVVTDASWPDTYRSDTDRPDGAQPDTSQSDAYWPDSFAEQDHASVEVDREQGTDAGLEAGLVDAGTDPERRGAATAGHKYNVAYPSCNNLRYSNQDVLWIALLLLAVNLALRGVRRREPQMTRHHRDKSRVSSRVSSSSRSRVV